MPAICELCVHDCLLAQSSAHTVIAAKQRAAKQSSAVEAKQSKLKQDKAVQSIAEQAVTCEAKHLSVEEANM